MFVVHGTKKFLDRVGAASPARVEPSTTALGDWYVKVLFWKPQVALFVNETTLLPVLVPFAPAATVVERFPPVVATVLRSHGVDDSFILREVTEMVVHRLAKTKNRSVLGIMNEFAYLGEVYRSSSEVELLALSLRLAETPCRPLYRSHMSPDHELAALVRKCHD